MSYACPRTTRAKTSTSTAPAPPRRRVRAQAETVAPVVRTSSTSSTRRPSSRALRAGLTAKAPATLRRRWAGLKRPWEGVWRRRRRQVGDDRDPGAAAERLGQQRRLVETPVEQPQPVQRHRRDQVGLGHQAGPGAGQPGTVARGPFGAVGVLEAEDQRPAALVVAHDRPGPVEVGALAHAGAAQRLRPQLEFQGEAADLAERRIEEVDPLPASGAERAGTLDRRPARQAARRQQRVERQPGQGANSFDGALDGTWKRRHDVSLVRGPRASQTTEPPRPGRCAREARGTL